MPWRTNKRDGTYAGSIADAIDAKWATLKTVQLETYDEHNGMITVDLPSGTLASTVTADSDSIGAPLKKVDLVVVPLNRDEDDPMFAVEHLAAAHN